MKAAENRMHQEVWGLLPWLANGRADAEQRRRAEAHLADCADCRAELAREQRFAAAMALPSAKGPEMTQGLARLMNRIEHAESVRAPRIPRIANGAGGAGGAATIRLSTAVALGAVQLALVAVAAAWWLRGGPAVAEAPVGGYQTLTQAPAAPTPATAGLRVVFHPNQPIGELQALLVTHGLAIVSGPTEAGVFTLTPTAPLSARELDTVAGSLRRSPAVAFAEATGPVASR